MKAIQYRAYGDYAENRLADLPAPIPADGQVLVAMRTVGINPLDNTSAPAATTPQRSRICRGSGARWARAW